jgi:sugar phosphate permease
VQRRALSGSRRWVSLLGASSAQIGLSYMEQGVPALVPYLKADLGLSSSGAGVFGVSVNAGRAAAGTFAGSVVERWGTRTTLLAGCLASGAAGIAAALMPFGWLTLVLLVVGGITQSAAIVAGIAGIGGWFAGSSRGVALGVRQAAVSAGGMLAAGSLPLIAITWGWRAALAAAGATTIVIGCAGALLYREHEADRDPRRSASGLTLASSVREILGETAIRRTLLVAMTLSASQYVVLAYVQLYFIEELHTSLGVAAGVLVATQAAGFVGRLGWGALSDVVFAGQRTGVLSAMLVLGSASAAGTGFVQPGQALPIGIPLAVLLGLVTVGAPGVYVALLADVAPVGRVAAAMGTGLTFILGAAVVVPPAFGALVDAADSYRVAWLALAALLLVNVPLTRSIGRVAKAARGPGVTE